MGHELGHNLAASMTMNSSSAPYPRAYGAYWTSVPRWWSRIQDHHGLQQSRTWKQGKCVYSSPAAFNLWAIYTAVNWRTMPGLSRRNVGMAALGDETGTCDSPSTEAPTHCCSYHCCSYLLSPTTVAYIIATAPFAGNFLHYQETFTTQETLPSLLLSLPLLQHRWHDSRHLQ